ncbi:MULTISPECIES: serine/threonine-protein kinase [Thermomonospora]|uniref:non-specific serine/threonine protein kinase n=1 Tax=Thermomonospora curvata (strain ATCC 19995 / DSM 43183 / JCM 3096 / KCTC 9072 / NBRC 15933 / NCIMB 10081 / Henssen B9) TaxID=471852 RepID=D1ADG2_THECD|nr:MULTISPECIES: serine/threonine-protein kinase [Thermomonospora]ACY95672.1 serine/threonine protein kinase [Thermomonospora curvata DSM 43183]
MTTADLVLDSRYRLLRRLATGGMGEVWEASDELLSRPVAVKLLRQEHVGNEQARARFRAEARYAAALQHSGIAQVYDYGEHDDLAYLVMELVSGESLSRILARQGALGVETTLDVVAQAARALQVAHSAGIIHRDVKPGNLMMTPSGVVKITDFGIARGLNVATLTQTGMVMGTAHYVSPEQASGQPITFATDLYSLGVVAYECLTGRPPFDAEQPVAIALKHVREAPPELPEEIPEAVRTLVRVLLAKNPEDRPPSAQAVADEAFRIHDALQAGEPVESSFRDLLAGSGASLPAHRFGDPFDDAFDDGYGDVRDGTSEVARTRLLDEAAGMEPATVRGSAVDALRPSGGLATWSELEDGETADTLTGVHPAGFSAAAGSRVAFAGTKVRVQRRTVVAIASVTAGVLALGAVAAGSLSRGPSAGIEETRDRVPSVVPEPSSLVPSRVPSPTGTPSLPAWPGPRPPGNNFTASTTPTPSASSTGRPRPSPTTGSPTPQGPSPTPSESGNSPDPSPPVEPPPEPEPEPEEPTTGDGLGSE